MAILHPWLRDTISQLLARWPVEILPIPDREALLTQASTGPDVVLVDPFAFGEPGLNLLQRLRRAAPATLIVVLLSADTRDYRDAAVRMGANGVVITEQSTTDLLPTLQRLLARARLVNDVADRIVRAARQGAPIGASAYGESPSSQGLQALSDQAVERLAAPPVPSLPIPSAVDDRPAQAQGEHTLLRGLMLSADSPSSTSTERVVRTACNLNCGAHFCGLNVTVRDGHLVNIEPADFPDQRYRRICLKGISYVQMVAHPDRLLYPLKRRGPRGQGDWERISWDQALDEIAEQMRRLAEHHGPESLMFFPYSGQLSALNGFNGVYLRLASLLGASGTSAREFGIDSAVPSGIEDTFGEGAGYLANDYTDLPNSRLILIWGGDPAQSRMNWWPSFLDAKRAGARLVAIDPKFSVTASKCDEWLPIRPGADLYLALALLRAILKQGWLDHDFVIRHTVAPLLVREDNARFLRWLGREGQERFVAWDEHVHKAALAEAAQAPALSGQFSVNGVACRPAFDRLREMLEPYTPEFASQRTGLPADRILSLAQDYATTRPARIFTLYGVDRWHHGATFGRLIAALAAFTGNLGQPGSGAGVDGFNEGILFSSQFATPGDRRYRPLNPASLPEQIVSGQPHPIKAMWVAFSNWLNQWPDQNHLRNAVLPRLDLLVTVDHFLTETARWSDYVLPAATLFEREDMVKGPGPYVQHQPPVLPPPGECRSDFDIAAALARRLGCGEYFSQPVGAYLAEIMAEGGKSLQGLSLEALRAKGVLQRNTAPESLVAHRDLKFKTATGRVEFYVERLLPYGRALPDHEPPAEADPEGDLRRRFPLVCITEHSRFRVHSTFSNAPWLREIDREPRAVLNPSTATSRGIADDDFVRVFNDRGCAILRARLSQAVPPGTVYLGQGWQSSDFHWGHAQSLTHAVTNPANAFGPNISFSDVLVEVARAEGEAGDAQALRDGH